MILITVAIITIIGVVAALLLWGTSQKFHIEEDPRIDLVEALLPGANCGACGRTGCREFASACIKAKTLVSLVCPGSSQETMDKIAGIVGLQAEKKNPNIAVLMCGGSCAIRPVKAAYDGVPTCKVAATLSSQDCSFGCLGFGDCVRACPYNAMIIDPSTALPSISENKCVGCGICVQTCPRTVLTIRPKGPRGLRVWCACSNTLKGALSIKEGCKAACIACGKCKKSCPHGAIEIVDFLARINPEKCKLCRKCVGVCPTGAIHTSNFPTPLPSPPST